MNEYSRSSAVVIGMPAKAFERMLGISGWVIKNVSSGAEVMSKSSELEGEVDMVHSYFPKVLRGSNSCGGLGEGS
jgi:hypothetical protein